MRGLKGLNVASNKQSAFICAELSSDLSVKSKKKYGLFFVAPRPNASQGLFIEVSGSHTTTHQSRQDSSGRVISSSQRPLTTDEHANPRRESNPQSQQAGGRRLTPWTGRPPELANYTKLLKFIMISLYDW